MTKTWGEPKHKAPLEFDVDEKKELSPKELKEHAKKFHDELRTGVGEFAPEPKPQKSVVIFDSKQGYKKK